MFRDETTPGDRTPTGEHRQLGTPLRGIAITLAGIACLAVLVLAVPPLREGFSAAISGDTATLREDIRDLGVAGSLIVLGLGLVHAFVWYPAEILDAAVGFVYDFWLALPMIMVVWLINGLVAFWIGRHAARPVLYRHMSRERFERLEGLIHRGGVTLLLGMRLIPIVPFSLFSYVAGAAHVPPGRFAWTTVVGYLPITAVFVYLGHRLEELSPTDPVLWAGAAILIALFLLTRRIGRMITDAAADAEEGEPIPAARPPEALAGEALEPGDPGPT